jgi:hypothetical protein
VSKDVDGGPAGASPPMEDHGFAMSPPTREFGELNVLPPPNMALDMVRALSAQARSLSFSGPRGRCFPCCCPSVSKYACCSELPPGPLHARSTCVVRPAAFFFFSRAREGRSAAANRRLFGGDVKRLRVQHHLIALSACST